MKLVGSQGIVTGEEIPLDRAYLTIGRGADVDVYVEDERVSRLHAGIRVDADGITVSDLGSQNGTFVNGVQLFEARRLRPGDEIMVGAAAFTLREGEAAVSAYSAEPEDLPVQWAEAPAGARRSRAPLIVGGIVLLGLAGLVAIAAWLALGPRLRAAVTIATTTPTVPAIIVAATPTAAPTATAAPATASATRPPIVVAATATPIVRLPTVAITLPPLPTVAIAITASPLPAVAIPTLPLPTVAIATLPLPTVAVATLPLPTVALPLPTPASGAALPALAPSYTVSWSPGTYDPWEGGRRLRTDLTITNVSLPALSPPYEPAFFIAGADGSLRQGDLHDYSSPSNPLPTLAPGQSVTWTWYTILTEQETVRGSAFRYAGLTWTQGFRPDGSLAGPPLPTSDQQLAPLLPTGVAPETIVTMLPTILPDLLPTLMPLLPTGVPNAP